MQTVTTIEGVTGAFRREAVEALAAGEPAWLGRRRLEAGEE
jgi:hypothetical protein